MEAGHTEKVCEKIGWIIGKAKSNRQISRAVRKIGPAIARIPESFGIGLGVFGIIITIATFLGC